MSFSSEVKNELCRISLNSSCCVRAEIYGILLCCNTFTSQEIRIITESEAFAQRLPKLLFKAFSVEFDRLPEEEEQKFVFQISDEKKLREIINSFGYDPQQNSVLHINFGVLEDECCRGSFLRGVFLSGGSITDPVKHYHLELATSHAQASKELQALLTDMGYLPRRVQRSGYQVTYFKNSDQIADLLTAIGAPLSAMELMNARVEKELRNDVNRRVNCEAANLFKAVDAAQEQLEAIRILYELDRVETLPDKLKETIILRETYPELTLAQLAAEFDPPLTKSCLNHRLRKLIELSKQ